MVLNITIVRVADRRWSWMENDMERLTMDKPVAKMNMTELALHSCYVKDGKARYRDYDTKLDSRDFVKRLLVEYGIVEQLDAVLRNNDAFDELMIEWLTYNPKEIEGLIALVYRNLWAMAELRERLKEYEDLEEQGLLVKLPCRVGDTVHAIINGAIVSDVVDRIEINESCQKVSTKKHSWLCDLSKIYPTAEAAEKALEDMKA